MELFKNSIDLEFFQKNTYKEVIKLRNARVKRYEKDREREEIRRKEEAARQQRGPGKLHRT